MIFRQALDRTSGSGGEEIKVKHNLAILFTALSLSVALSSTTEVTQASSGEALMFSGAVTGSWSQTRVVQCDFKSRAGRARAAFAGSVSGGSWTFSLDIGPYKGPGTYDAKGARNIGAVLDDGRHNPNTSFSSAGAGSALITVAADEKSGTVQALLWSDTGRWVRISGSWRC